MRKSMKILAVSSMVGFANLAPIPLIQSGAEEMIVNEGSSSKLSVLEIAEFELDQTFSPERTEYTASVANKIQSVSLLMETFEAEAVISLNGTIITSGQKVILPLETGENIFTVMVLTGNESTTYTITVIRAKNDNNQLAKLTLSSGEIDFHQDITDYSIQLENEINTLTVKPELAVATSTVKVNGKLVDSEASQVEIPVGKSTITIVVEAENGNQKVYTVQVTRALQDNQAPSSNTGTASTDKQSTTDTDAKRASDSVSSSKSNQESQSSNTGTSSSKQPSTPSTSARGTSGSLHSSVAGNKSSAQEGTSANSGQMEAATTANLSSLTVSTGTWNKPFDEEIYTYHLAVDQDVTSVTIHANPEESDAEVLIEDGDSTTLTLEAKARTVISVEVTNGNDRKTYVLIFDKDIGEVATETATEDSSASAEPAAAISNEKIQGTTRTRTDTPQSNPVSNGQSNESSSLWSWIKSLFGF